MATTVQLTAIGNSIGIVLPQEVLERLRVSNGDRLRIIETANGIELTPDDAEFSTQLAVAENVMREDGNLLKRLAE